ncbi:type II toxin-antitoxin system RelE/ParE family toxin [Candidatus Halobeggiatoa sp. HSG11]|nr:type II toxin-antitoxin system RelE/ParE family toxin [Candidatus Halobeggiatoa sp. HSG11]
MMYKIELRPGVVRQVKKLPEEVRDWFFEVTENLASNPTPKNSRTVTNSPYMRIKPDRHIDNLETKQYKAVQNYRIVYLLHEESIEVIVISIAHRKEIYKRLAKF